jgi:hypothetical protein
MLAVFVLPSIRGDGTATGDVKVSLLYSLQTVSFILSFTALWLGCVAISRELERHRLQLVMTKPATAWQVWLAKCVGVFSICAVLLLLSCLGIYGSILYRLKHKGYPEAQLKEVRNEVLVGRSAKMPVSPDFEEMAVSEYARRARRGELQDVASSKEQYVSTLSRQLRAQDTEIQAGQQNMWRFTDVNWPEKLDSRMTIKYRLFVDSTKVTAQRFTRGRWFLTNEQKPDRSLFLSAGSGQIMGGKWHSITFKPVMEASDGRLVKFASDGDTVTLHYKNEDPANASVFFQHKDGPQLMVKSAGFTENFLRGTLLILLRLATFTILGCAASALFSTPVSLFFIFSYLIASIVLNVTLPDISGHSFGNLPHGYSKLAFLVNFVVSKFVVNMKEFDVPLLLTKGYFIATTRLISVSVFQILIRVVPLAALSMLALSHRELGKVIRK